MKLSELDLVTRLLVALTAFMALLVVLMVYMVLLHPTDAVSPATSGAPGKLEPTSESTLGAPCDLSRPDADPCPGELICLGGRCQAIEKERVCREGESCRDCECAPGLLCHRLRCRDRDDLSLAPLDCRTDKAVADAVKKLVSDCETREVSVGQLVSLEACSGDDWQAISLGNEQFDILLTAFKYRFSVHFPPNEPNRRKSWPGKRERERYLQQLRKLREPLATAKQIFIIGRSSPDGNKEDNYKLALRRMDMVAGLVEEVVFAGLPRTEQKPLPIQQWAMRDERLVAPEYFARNYLSRAVQADFGVPPWLTWDETSEAWFQKMLAETELTDAQRKALLSAINRVVLVVPIPCDGTEYIPPKDPVITISTSQ